MRTYTGRRTADGCDVTVFDDAGELAPALRLDLRRHSLTGSEWGTAGAGLRNSPRRVTYSATS